MSNDQPVQAAAQLVVLVPEAEALVSRFRTKHPPSTTMPAHITINGPFVHGVDPNQTILHTLRDIFVTVTPFSFALDNVATFPSVVYLSPTPIAPFNDLVEKVVGRFPESPPYRGVFKPVIPHLTVARADSDLSLVRIKRELKEDSPAYLPIRSKAESVWLMDNSTGRWEKRASFSLASP